LFLPLKSYVQDYWEKIILPGGGSTQISSIITTNNGNIFAGTDIGVYSSTDNGESWEKILMSYNIYSLTIGANGYIYAGNYNGIYRSIDNGNHWTQKTKDLKFYQISSSKSGYIIAGTDSGIVRSSNFGDSWAPSGLKKYDIYSLLITSSGIIFASTYDGIFRSIENGNSWKGKNEGLTLLFINSFLVTPNDYVFAGSTQATIFRSINTTTDVEKENYSTPLYFSFAQKYPNPFNSTTKIKYSIPLVETEHSDKSGQVASSVQLKVYDILGNQVETLINKQQFPGNYEVEFNAMNFSSGIYLYRIESGNFAPVKKMILLR
jgi:photosystem II stability/assembly factor-like uncharacterized protein